MGDCGRRFLKDGEPGRKVTCQECHKQKYGDAKPDEAENRADRELAEKTRKKNKKLAPKFTPDLLLDRNKGLTAVFKSFPKHKFKGKGHEASDLRKLLGKYAEWAHVLVPDMEFTDFITRLEKGRCAACCARRGVESLLRACLRAAACRRVPLLLPLAHTVCVALTRVCPPRSAPPTVPFPATTA